MWTHRIMLECLEKKDNSFLTLTYQDKELPRSGHGNMTLEPTHLQNFLKRLRWQWSNNNPFEKAIGSSGMSGTATAPAALLTPTLKKLRFYAVGEYGDESFRPHYHAAIFGLACARGRTLRRGYSTRPEWRDCCPTCSLVGTVWGHGDVDLGNMVIDRAQYLAGYVTKKMTRSDDPRLDDRHPEFARMSLRPGIGANAMHDVASVMLELGLDTSEADVPSALRHGNRSLPLGRYLRQRLRLLIGKEPGAPLETLQAAFEEVRPLWEAAQVAPTPDTRVLAFKNALIDADNQRVLNMEARQKLRKPWRSQ